MSTVVENVTYWGGPRDSAREAVSLAIPEGHRFPAVEAPEGCYILTSYPPLVRATKDGTLSTTRRVLLWQIGACIP